MSLPLFRVSRTYAASVVDGEWLSLKNRIWVCIALAVGFALRVNELGAQSLWNDEGTSVALAQTSLAAIVNAAAHDIHPPLYYILLSGWIQAAGIGEFALRFLSVFAGVLVIALTFRIAREFFDQDVAVIAAVLSAFNPFQIYYAQETRMYIWVTLFAALSVWTMVRMLKPSPEIHPPSLAKRIRIRLACLGLYVLATLAALYTNYYAFTLVVFENLIFLAWLAWALRAGRPRVGHSIAFWMAAQVVIVLAYLPWLSFASTSLTSWPGISDPMSLPDMGWRIVSAFATGADAPRDFQIVLVAAYILFFLGGLLPSRDLFRQSAWGIVTGALWAVVPLAAMYVVSLSRPAYNSKFLLLATPGFLILVARGVSVLYPGLFLRERAPYGSMTDPVQNRLVRQYIGIGKLLVGGLFAVGLVAALQNLYSDPRLRRDDYRGIVNYINAVATDRDAVIVNAPGQMDVVRYYYHSAAQLVGLPIGRPLRRDATQTALDALASRDNIFGIFWATDQSDPDQFIERHLAETTYKASDEWHGNVRLTQYAAVHVPDVATFSSDFPFGDEIELVGYKLPAPTRVVTDFVPVELDWLTLEAPPARYKVFVQLLDASGHLVSQRDAEPQDGFFTTDRWTPGETIVDRLAIPIPPGLPPGTYRVIAGLYRVDNGVRLPVTPGGDFVTLGEIQVGKKIYPRAAFFFTGALEGHVDGVSPIGYELKSSNFARGEFIPLVLYFQTVVKPVRDITLYAQLRDQGDNVISSARTYVDYPTTLWDAGEIVRDVQTLPIPQDALPGEYHIVVTDGDVTVDVSRVQVK